MTRRIGISMHEITRVHSGEQCLFLRPVSSFFTRVREGDRLWLAEPFFLEKRFDGYAPTVARDLGAVPAFAADHVYNPGAIARTHGKRHPARSLCKEWHRAHLVVTSRTELRLQELPDEDIAELGFASRSSFARHWDTEAALVGVVGFKFSFNPRVYRFGFSLVRQPIALTPRQPAKKRGRPARKPGEPTQNSATHGPAPVVAPEPMPVAAPPATVAPPPPERPAVRPVAAPPAPAPAPAPVSAAPVTQQGPLGETFTTAKGDKAFLAALRRERPRAHADFRAASSPAARPRPVAPTAVPTGECPCCGTRLAYGCEHHPLIEAAE